MADLRIRGKYKGVPLIMENEIESGGRKLALNKYVYSDRQSVRDIGGVPQTFTASVVFTGQNYIEDAANFRNLLVDGEPGELVLMSLGVVDAYVSNYRRENGNTSISEIIYSITFVIEEMQGAAAGLPDISEQQIYQKYLEANSALSDSVLDNWEVPNSNSNRLAAALDNNEFLNSVESVVGGINDATRAVERAKNQLDTAINRAETYADIFVENGPLAALSSAVGLGASYRRAKDLLQFGNDLPNRLSDIGGTVSTGAGGYDINLWDSDIVAEWNRRNKTRTGSVETQRLSALLLLLQQAGGAIGASITTANKIKADISDAIDNIVVNQPYKSELVTPNLSGKIFDLRDVVIAYIDKKSDDLFYTTTRRVVHTSPRVVAYDLYDSTEDDFALRLGEINNGKQYVDGKITVLERQR